MADGAREGMNGSSPDPHLFVADPQPPVFERVDRMGCAIQGLAVDGAAAGLDDSLAAIGLALPGIDIDMLAAHGARGMDSGTFLYGRDAPDNSLRWPGTVTIKDGRILKHPRILDLETLQIQGQSGGFDPPGTGGGHLSKIFLCPPYSMRGRPAEFQDAWDALCATILPHWMDNLILDWTGEWLPDAHPLFVPGMEWWGVHLYTIFQREAGRIVVLWASETD